MEKPNLLKEMITLEATKQIAYDSPDHICPVGSIRDNFSSLGLIGEVTDYFNGKQISVLDLGCAGGQFVVDFIKQGDIGVGLEGSSNSLKGVGKKNWDKYHNKNLFLCDITKDYQLYQDSHPMEFDFIHSEEVFEHIAPEDIDSMLKNIIKHLKPGGLCVFGVSLVPDVRNENGEDMVPPFAPEDRTIGYTGELFTLHQAVFPATWWKEKLESNGFKIFEDGLHDNNHFGYLFKHIVRGAGYSGNNEGYPGWEESAYFCCTK
jgi:SAM-dependent methyltransferase